MFFKSKFLKGVKFLGISKLPIFSGAAISACERNMEWQRGIFLLEMMMDVKCELDVSNSVDWKKLLLCWSYKFFWNKIVERFLWEAFFREAGVVAVLFYFQASLKVSCVDQKDDQNCIQS